MPNISRSTGDQTIKFGQFIEYKIINGLSIQNMVQKLVTDPFDPFWPYLWINSLSILSSFFILHAQVEDYQNILKLRCCPVAFTSYKGFLKKKTKKGRKMFLLLYSINWLNLIAWLPLLVKILGNMCIIIIYSPVCDAKKNWN